MAPLIAVAAVTGRRRAMDRPSLSPSTLDDRRITAGPNTEKSGSDSEAEFEGPGKVPLVMQQGLPAQIASRISDSAFHVH